MYLYSATPLASVYRSAMIFWFKLPAGDLMLNVTGIPALLASAVVTVAVTVNSCPTVTKLVPSAILIAVGRTAEIPVKVNPVSTPW